MPLYDRDGGSVVEGIMLIVVNRLKLKRPQTAKAFRQDLDELYEEALAEEKTVKAKL